MTPCHGVQAALCPIYVLPQGQRVGRKEIGHIPICPAEKCSKVIGEPIRYRGTGGFSDEEWQKMLKTRPFPPFYFVKTKTGLVPEDIEDSSYSGNFGRTEGSGGKSENPKFPLTGSEKAAGEAIEEPEWINGE